MNAAQKATDEMLAAVAAKLAELGFVNGMYGDVPYYILCRDLGLDDTDYQFSWYVMVDGRSMGIVLQHTDGTMEVQLDFARWLNPPKKGFILGQRVQVGTIPIRTDVKVNYADMNFKHYNPIERAIKRTKEAI